MTLCKKSFKEGAEWAIKNLWNSSRKKPKEDGKYFVKNDDGYGVAVYSKENGWYKEFFGMVEPITINKWMMIYD